MDYDDALELIAHRIEQLTNAKSLAEAQRDKLQLSAMQAGEQARNLDTMIMGLVKSVNAINIARRDEEASSA